MSMLKTAEPEAAVAARELTLGEAVKEALAEELRRDRRVFVMGEDVAEAGTAFKVLTGLVAEFGPERVLDTPISEAGFTGIGVGAAMTGLRPVVDIMFGDFVGIIMDQMMNQAANGMCRWFCARRSERPAAPPRSTRNRCTPGSATSPG